MKIAVVYAQYSCDNQTELFYRGTKQIGSDERAQELQTELYL